MYSAELVINEFYKSKKGYSISVRLLFNSKYTFIKTGIYSNSKRIGNNPDVIRRNAKLLQEIAYCNENRLELDDAKNVIKEGVPKDPEIEIAILKKRIEKLQALTGRGLLNFFEVIIEEKERLGDSVKAYKEAKAQLMDYLVNDVSLNSLDYNLMLGFVNHKKGKGTGQPGINMYLRQIRAVYNEAIRRGLCVNNGNPFKGLIKVVDRKHIDIPTPEELKLLFNYKPKKGASEILASTINRNINLFLFQLAIGGHDLADIANLRWKNINRGRINFSRYKNRNKISPFIDNNLNDFCLKFIDDYGNKKDNKVFSFIPEPNLDSYNNFRDSYGKSLARISINLEIPRLKTKLPRYIFRTYADRLFIDELVKRQIMGHAWTGTSSGYGDRLPNNMVDDSLDKVNRLVF